MNDQQILYYIHDPMCSWCWGFKNTWQQVQNQLPENIIVQYVLGGLAPDNEQPMPDEMQTNIRDTWRSIQNEIPGIEFNFDFWTQCKPRRSTYLSCRAVIAARNQMGNSDQKMLLAIQQAYYLRAMNPSDQSTLITLAEEIGLDIKTFITDLTSDVTNLKLEKEFRLRDKLNAHSFPSLVLYKNHTFSHIDIDYIHPENILNQIKAA